MPSISRRSMLGGALAGVAGGMAGGGMAGAGNGPLVGGMLARGGVVAVDGLATPAIAQDVTLRIGVMLPFSGGYAAIGEAIAAAFDMHLKELGGKMGRRPVELVRVDDEPDPVVAQSRVNRLLGRDKVEVLVGTVRSETVMTMVRASRDQAIPLIIPHAGDTAATRELCAPSVFRSSFSNWQPAYGMGAVLAAKGVKQAALVTWDGTAGDESGEGFGDGLRSGGAELTKVLRLRQSEMDPRPVLTRLAGLGVGAVAAFLSGEGAVQFVKAYAASGLRDKMPLCGGGFLTEGNLNSMGAAADGLQTALHYGDRIDNAKNLAFRAAYKAFSNHEADVYAVQGYDAAQMLAIGLDAAEGNTEATPEFAAAIRAATIDSPRGAFTVSASHNPIQTIWLREAKNGENRVVGAAAEALADPGSGCAMT